MKPRWLALVALMGCWTNRAQPVAPSSVHVADEVTDRTRDYHHVTLAMDAAGVASMAAGLLTLRPDGSNDMAGAMLTSGMLVAGFGDVTAHLVAGRRDRAWKSYLVRAATVTATGLGGMAVGCGDRGMDLDCSFKGLGWGTAAGLAVAGLIDAFVLQRD